ATFCRGSCALGRPLEQRSLPGPRIRVPAVPQNIRCCQCLAAPIGHRALPVA
ncbi:unnamed protein product, partial [Polarella glacialis]